MAAKFKIGKTYTLNGDDNTYMITKISRKTQEISVTNVTPDGEICPFPLSKEIKTDCDGNEFIDLEEKFLDGKCLMKGMKVYAKDKVTE